MARTRLANLAGLPGAAFRWLVMLGVGGGLFGSALSPAAAAAKPARVTSAYVSLKEADCTVVKAPGAGEESEDWSVSRCGKPVGGWKVYVVYSDARDDIELERNGVRTSLGLTQLHGNFSVVGPALEFRLRNGTPFAAVVRHIIQTSEDPVTNTSLLLVARLRPQPCLVAEFPPGANQSALARVAADKADTLACLP